MTEFSDREKIIIITTTYINHPATKSVPDGVLIFGLKSMLMAKGIKIEGSELKDIMDAIKNEQVLSMKEGFGFLNKNKDKLGGLESLG